MRIAIFSDCHCGYAFEEERGDDSFKALEDSIEKSLDSDLILIAGDLFDSRIPKPEVFARTAKILSRAQNLTSKTKLISAKNKDSISPSALRGIPIVAIHGTHERRSKLMINPIQSLEYAGLLIHLHCATAIFEIDGKKVAVHGMSGVPERYARDCLLEWNPTPIRGAINILMLHQSVDPYIYSPLEPPSLKLEDLPQGFDFYILGHMHWHDNKKIRDGQLLLPGSTVSTSLHKIESEQKKGIFIFNGTSVEFLPLANQRKIIWIELEVCPELKEQITQKLVQINETKKPIAVVKIKGTLPKGQQLPSFSDIEQRFYNNAIIYINKSIETESFEENIMLLRQFREQKLSPEEHGLKILQENLSQTKCGLKVEELFDLLVEGNVDLIFNLLSGKQMRLK